MPTLAIGIDLGGTNLRAALYSGLEKAGARRSVDDRMPQPVARHSELVGESRQPEKIAARMARIVIELVRKSGFGDTMVPVGIGLPGLLKGPHGVMGVSPHLGWRDVPFGTIMRRALGDHWPIVVHNDANAITYGEYAVGAGVGVDDLLAVYVGTGIGAGIIAGGRLLQGATHCAGEVGHFKVVYGDDAPLCNCGMRGCAETFIGGTYVQARVRRDLASGAKTEALELAGGNPAAIHTGHLDRAAARGDQYALDLYTEIAPPVAMALGSAINLLNPARLILGGGVLSSAPVLRGHLVASLTIATSSVILEPCTVVEAALGDDAGLIGGALLAGAIHWEQSK